MDAQLTVRGYLERAHLDTGAAGIPTQEILDLAGSFLFRGSAVDKKIGVLSGGERARLCLAGLLLARYPVLLLDEPTNHLDFETTEALAEALSDYNGTVLFTCHDRTFVAAIASDVLEVRNGTVTRFGDGYDAYVWRLEREAEAEAGGGAAPAAAKTAKAAPAADRRDETKAMRRSRLEQLSKARNRLKKLEATIAALDAEGKALTAQLADRYEREAGERLQVVTAQLAEAESTWLEVGAEVEQLAGEG
jgi:ATP-binding cassette subfamily F protein 3